MTAPYPIAEELLTEAEAVRRVHGRDATVRAWLRELGIARRGPTGARLYLWSEVCAALVRERDEPARPLQASRGSLRRSSRV
jgi:hypothetical protein